MAKFGQPESDEGTKIQKPDLATQTVELIVTAEMREKIALKRLKRQKGHLPGDELHATEVGEIDLGNIDP